MLIQLLIDKPQMIGPILSGTPVWVWLILAALLLWGMRMRKATTMGAMRTAIVPVVLTGLSLAGTISSFGHTAAFAQVVLAWAVVAVSTAAAIAMTAPPAGTHYNVADRSFTVPGSWMPMLLIVGIFLVKYMVGIESRMDPSLAHSASYSLTYGVLYGVFSGIFSGRSLRLARLALRSSARSSTPTVIA